LLVRPSPWQPPIWPIKWGCVAKWNGPPFLRSVSEPLESTHFVVSAQYDLTQRIDHSAINTYLSFHQRISSLSAIFNFHHEKQCESAIFFPFGLSCFHPFMRFKTSARVQLRLRNLRSSLNYLRESSKEKGIVRSPMESHASVQCAVTMINGDSGWRLLFDWTTTILLRKTLLSKGCDVLWGDMLLKLRNFSWEDGSVKNYGKWLLNKNYPNATL